ncbi:MAG: hypothetical protein CVU44_20375 [Chloroflexi bacterium HGW-Chloroflexi-6]|nr:MAG: hypothetical protein CVU44_20375 [Chloroflexi bacterium HGW-Chloroflexi-6]
MKFFPDLSNYEETDRRLVLFVLGGSLIASILLFIAEISREFLPFLIIALILAFTLAWRGNVRIAGWLAPLAALAILTLLVFRNFGIRDTALLGFPVTIVAGSLMNGRKGALIFGLACLLIVVTLGITESTGQLQTIFSPNNTLADYVVVCVVIMLTTAMQWTVISRLAEKTHRAKQELNERRQAEIALRESEERYRSMVETFPDIIMLTNLRGEIQFVNAALEQQTGYTMTDLQEKDKIFIHPQDASTVSKAIQDLLAGDNSCTDLIQNRFIDKQGQEHWYSGIIGKIHYQGELMLQTVTREITAQKAAEAALRQSEERYRLITSVASDYTYSTKLDAAGNLYLDWVAGAFESITGYTYDEYQANGGWFTHLHPDDVAKDLLALEKLKSNQPVAQDIRVLTKTKEIMWVRVYALPIWGEKENRVVGIIGAVQNITERKQTEELITTVNFELQRRIKELYALNEVAQAGASAKSENGMLEAVVETLYRSLYPDIVGVALWDEQESVLRTHPSANRGLPANIDQGQMKARPYEGVVGTVAATRQPYRVNDTSDPQYLSIDPNIHSELCVPILAADRLLGVLDIESKQANAFSESDENLLITVAGQLASALERLRAEQGLRHLNAELEQRVNERTALLETANKELEAFSYSVSHDLRAPLRAITSFARILDNDFSSEMEPTARGFLHRIITSGKMMNRLIDELLDFSRLGRKPLKIQPLDMNGIARHVIENLADETASRQIEWVLTDMPLAAADLTLIQQVYANLIGNAVKYTGKRETARIEVGSFEKNQETVYFVRDNGAGFDMQYADRLFGVFQRLHRDDEFEGTGIGLATVQRIIQRHGGRTWAEAEPDKGATFYFTLEGMTYDEIE